jgi:hypothetical protein
VEENRDRCDGDMGQTQGHQHQSPPGQLE